MTQTEEQRYWVWVAAPDRYGTEEGGEHPDLDPTGGGTWWSCHRSTRAGDLAVLYRAREAKDIAYRLRAVGDAYELPEDRRPAPGQTHACDVEVLDRFARPIPLTDLRSDPVVAAWPALRSSFSRGAAPVPAEVWARLMEMAELAEAEEAAEEAEAAEVVEVVEVVEAAVEAAAERSTERTAPSLVGDADAWGSPALAVTEARPSRDLTVVVLGAFTAAVLAGVIVRGLRRRR